jgi:hypothetical protein
LDEKLDFTDTPNRLQKVRKRQVVPDFFRGFRGRLQGCLVKINLQKKSGNAKKGRKPPQPVTVKRGVPDFLSRPGTPARLKVYTKCGVTG